MKKIVSVLLAVLMAAVPIVLSSCGSNASISSPRATYTREYAGTTLNVFNWGEYISDGSEGSLNVNKAFESLTGIHVNYATFESNEAMYGKLKSGAVSYDVIIPSDFMIERLIKEDMLQPLDTAKLTNYDLIDP